MKDRDIYSQIVENEPYCQLCGSSNYLHIHHVYYRSQGGLTTPKNLIRLCEKCHMLVHSNKKKYQPMLLLRQYDRYGYFEKEEVVKHKNNIKSITTNN